MVYIGYGIGYQGIAVHSRDNFGGIEYEKLYEVYIDHSL